MATSSPLPKDDPRILAWEKYKATEEYGNSFRWVGMEQHRDGSMWAAFLSGWTAAIESALDRETMSRADGGPVLRYVGDDGFLYMPDDKDIAGDDAQPVVCLPITEQDGEMSVGTLKPWMGRRYLTEDEYVRLFAEYEAYSERHGAATNWDDWLATRRTIAIQRILASVEVEP